MKNKFTENAEMQSGNPAELSDDELDSVGGGYTRIELGIQNKPESLAVVEPNTSQPQTEFNNISSIQQIGKDDFAQCQVNKGNDINIKVVKSKF